MLRTEVPPAPTKFKKKRIHSLDSYRGASRLKNFAPGGELPGIKAGIPSTIGYELLHIEQYRVLPSERSGDLHFGQAKHTDCIDMVETFSVMGLLSSCTSRLLHESSGKWSSAMPLAA